MAGEPYLIVKNSKGYQWVVKVPSNKGNQKVKVGRNIFLDAEIFSQKNFIGNTYRFVDEKWKKLDSWDAEENLHLDSILLQNINSSLPCGELGESLEDTDASESDSADGFIEESLQEYGSFVRKDNNPTKRISEMVNKSTTFHLKSQFSKEKYIKKKREKYILEVTLLPVTLHSIAETYFKRSFRQIGGLRFDYLSTMVNFSCVSQGMNVIIFDHSGGLLTAAVLQRLGGTGNIFFVTGSGFSTNICSLMNFPPSYMNTIKEIPILLIRLLLKHNITLKDMQDAEKDIAKNYFFKCREYKGYKKRKLQRELPPTKVARDSPPLKTDEELQSKNAELELHSAKLICDLPLVEHQGDSVLTKVQSKVASEQNTGDSAFTECVKIERLRERLQLFLGSPVEAVIACFSTDRKTELGDHNLLRDLICDTCDRFLQPAGRFSFFSQSHSHVAAAQYHLMAQRETEYTSLRFEELFLAPSSS